METILERLFFGDINPLQDNTIMSDHDYKEARDGYFQVEEKLEETLSAEQKELLKEYSDAADTVDSATAKYYFISGFTLGSKIMMEILK